MSTERHVCSLELSRRLAEAGFPQATEFVWYGCEGLEPEIMCQGDSYLAETVDRVDAEGWLFRHAAPMLSEVIEQLVPHVARIEYVNPGWIAKHNVDGGAIFWAATGPDAAGALWLALRGEK